MIPLEYRLREPVRVEQAADGGWMVVSESPLTVLRVNAAAARLLEGARCGASVGAVVTSHGVSEERALALCEYFRGRGILDVRRTALEHDFTPTVTVIVPTRDRADDLDRCLAAVSRLDYPPDQLEVVVVDDASRDPGTIVEVAAHHGVRLLVNEENRGPSYSRNRASFESASDVLAFVDSDCVPGPAWLRELVPHFLWDRVGAVGGRTVGYRIESPLDRYEEVSSPLDMGRRLLLGTRGQDTFYVPTCNLLVRRTAYLALGGLREDLLVGEDVDFCWRLRATGAYLVYAPEGVVRHKHRDNLGSMLRRRASYGTSEAALHVLHPDKRKRFPVAPAALATGVVLSAALIGRQPRLLAACVVPPLWDGARRILNLRRNGVRVPARSVWTSVLRGHLSTVYSAYFHLVRYYLGPLAAIGLLTRGAWVLGGVAIACSSAVDYSIRRPRLSYPLYLGYYLAEHAAYQAGVVAGCVRTGSFGSYSLRLQVRTGTDGRAPLAG